MKRRGPPSPQAAHLRRRPCAHSHLLFGNQQGEAASRAQSRVPAAQKTFSARQSVTRRRCAALSTRQAHPCKSRALSRPTGPVLSMELVGVGVLYSITTFMREITPLLQIRQVAQRMEHYMQPARAPRAKEHTNNPVQRPNCRGQGATKLRDNEMEALKRFPTKGLRKNDTTLKAVRGECRRHPPRPRGQERGAGRGPSNFRLDPAVLSAPPWTAAKASGTPPGLQAKRGGSGHRPAPAAAVPAIPLVPVAKAWTGTSTHAAQTQAQAGTTRAGTQRHVGLAARACTETSMHAAQTQARTQHEPPE